MPQFDISHYSSQAFWLVVVFTALYLIISRVVAPTAKEIFTNREGYISTHLEEAEYYNKKASLICQKNRDELTEIEEQANERLQEAIRTLEEKFLQEKDRVAQNIKDINTIAMNDIIGAIDEFRHREKMDEKDAIINFAGRIIHNITGDKPDLELLEKIHKEEIR